MAHGEIHVELSVNYADDPKVAALARFGNDARGARDLYVQMICYAKANLTDGFVPAEVVGRLVYPDAPAAGSKQGGMLVEVGLVTVTDGGWKIGSYLKRNKSRAQVVRLSKARAEAGRVGGRRSGMVRSSQAKPKQNAKQGASAGLNTESLTESESESGGSAKRGTRLPDDFTIDLPMADWCRERKITRGQAEASTERFVNYWRAKTGRDATKLDWPATWRNWLLRDYPGTDTAAPLSRGASLDAEMGL